MDDWKTSTPKRTRQFNKKRWHILLDLLKKCDGHLMAEIGVRKAANFYNLMRIKGNWNIHWVGVDPHKAFPSYPKWSQESLAAAKKVALQRIAKYPTATFLPKSSYDASWDFPNGHFDLVFIDADHCYEAVEQDIRLWRHKVKRGGILCGHDYHHPRFPDVTEAVDRYFSEVNTDEDYVWWQWVDRCNSTAGRRF